VSAVLSPATTVAASDLRIALEKHEADCLRAWAEVRAALAGGGLDDVLTARAESLQRTLDDIRAALARVDAGTYGRCTCCGDAIPAARLELRPYAAMCVPCAGGAGRGGR
jgi:DnaK suppressor protein